MKDPKINVMIEEHIYHFLTGLSFSFFLLILLLLSPGYIGTLPLQEKKNRTSCGVGYVNQKYYSAFDIVAAISLQGGKKVW